MYELVINMVIAVSRIVRHVDSDDQFHHPTSRWPSLWPYLFGGKIEMVVKIVILIASIVWHIDPSHN